MNNERNYNREFSNIDVDTFSKKCIEGSRSSSKAKRKEKMKKQRMVKKLKALAVTCVLAGGLSVMGINSLINTVQNNISINDARSDFQMEVVRDNTHRTQDNEGYWYDYSNICSLMEDRIENGADQSTEIYLLTDNMGEKQADKVLAYYNGGTSVDEFISERGLTQDRWESIEKDKIITSSELNSKQSELNKMMSETNSQVNSQQADLGRGIN